MNSKYKTNKSLTIKKSYGIPCCRFNNKTKKIELLLIKKRCTFAFIEFILKCQNRNDYNKLLYLFDHMTHDEKLDILSLDFGRMWYRLSLVNPDSPFTPDSLKLPSEKYEKYVICRNNFERNFSIDKGQKLQELICKSQNSECLWEIPKGRKLFPQEKDIVCAMREFFEETGVSNADYIVLDETPLITSNIALNIKYINYYYLAIMSTDQAKIKNIKLNYASIQQMSEVSDIGWFDVDQIQLLDPSKKLYQFVKGINKILRKRYKIRKVFELNLLSTLPIFENNDE